MPTLHTLGELRLESFRKSKPLLLLAYLSWHGDMHRQTLQALFWPQAEEPGNNLRVALHSLNAVSRDLVTGGAVLRTAVEWDVQRVLTSHGETALKAYTGEFLQGVDLVRVVPQPLHEWVENVRTQVSTHLRRECLVLAKDADTARAQAWCEQAFRLPGPPPTEAELRQMVHLSRPGSVLHTAVLQRLKESGLEAVAPRSPIRSVLGRETELQVLLYWALQVGGSVAVISGLGGTGKSTLAREVLVEAQALGLNPTHCDAQQIFSGAELFSRLMVGLAIQTGLPDSWRGLRPWLGIRPVVLLDGLDDLDDVSGLLEELSGALPDVHWLITTRRQPDLTALRPPPLALRLGGLKTPAAGATPEEVAASPAAQLLMQELERRGQNLTMTVQLASTLTALTRLVLGHPLALRLLAVHLTQAPGQPVTRQQEAPPDYGGLDIPALLHPLAATDVMQLTWRRLSDSDQQALIALAPFDDFTPSSAQAVGVNLVQLQALDAQALLDLGPDARISTPRSRLHPLVKGFLEQLPGSWAEKISAARNAHAQYFLRWAGGLEFPAQAMGDHLGNVLRALDSHLGDEALSLQAVRRLGQHYDVRGLHRTGVEIFSRLDKRAQTPHVPLAVQAEVRVQLMWLLVRTGQYGVVESYCHALLDSPMNVFPLARNRALHANSVGLSVSGRLSEAIQYARLAVAAANEGGDPSFAAQSSAVLLWFLLTGERNVEATTVLTALTGKVDTLPGALRPGVQQQILYARLCLHRHERLELMQEAAAVSRTAHDLGIHIASASLRFIQAVACWHTQNYGLLKALAEELIVYTQTYPLVVHEMQGWYLLGVAQHYLQEGADARRSLRTGLALALERTYQPEIISGVALSTLELGARHAPLSRSWLHAVADDPQTTLVIRQFVRGQLPQPGDQALTQKWQNPREEARHALSLLQDGK